MSTKTNINRNTISPPQEKKIFSTLDKMELKNVDNVKLEYRLVPAHTNTITFTPLFDILISYPQLDLYDRVVYCTLHNYASSKKFKSLITNVSTDSVALRTGISKSKVEKSIAYLQSLGIIKLQKNPNKYERLIYIVRDFLIKQPEQIEVEQQHPELFLSADNLDDF